KVKHENRPLASNAGLRPAFFFLEANTNSRGCGPIFANQGRESLALGLKAKPRRKIGQAIQP
ncbi:MAG: hypothetical protein QMD16_02780, partial [Desulfitobacteriaceae bacterium]|nr:hypothetical protein [Desulfitobacteriaceae bacterium]MDI6878282.1 hypothetical protein [Desulfitobacteriaceae bacterium]